MLEHTRYHFVGVAGVGMSAVAQAAVFAGRQVTGSDRYADFDSEAPILKQLAGAGVKIYPQDGSGVAADAEVVVVSTAIEHDNPDLVAAKAAGIPVLHRSELLAQLVADKRCVAVAGTSGKSTVTGMVGWILEQTGYDPSVVNGAPVMNWRSPACIGNVRQGGDLWVIEADESDRSLLNYSPEYAVITNMSADHFGLQETVALFERFKQQVKHSTVGILDEGECLADEEPVINAASCSFRFEGVDFRLALPGRHNVENALHAAMLCRCLGVSLEQSAEALQGFKGIHRRLEVVGKGGGVTVIDDYGHNPAKIAAALQSVIPFARRGIVIWRPHGYGPLRNMLDELVTVFCEFCGADDRLLLLPVYDAGGRADRSIGVEALVERLIARGVAVDYVASHDEALELVAGEAQEGDAVIIMGARDPDLPDLAQRILGRIA